MQEDSETGEESTDESTTPDAADSPASDETAESPSKEVTVSDSVVSGNVHTGDVHHHYTATDSQETSNTSATFGPPTISSSSPGGGFVAPVMVGAVGTQMAQPQPYGQVLMVGPPSSSAKIIGVLLIIIGGFNLLIGLLGIVGADWLADLAGSNPDVGIDDPEGYKIFVQLVSVSAFIVGVGYLTSGIWMTKFQTRGIQLALVTLGINLITDIILGTMYPEFGSGYMAIEIGGAVFCNGICALMVAIPLMVANNGLDGSSLFSRSPTLVATGNSEDN